MSVAVVYSYKSALVEATFVLTRAKPRFALFLFATTALNVASSVVDEPFNFCSALATFQCTQETKESI